MLTNVWDNSIEKPPVLGHRGRNPLTKGGKGDFSHGPAVVSEHVYMHWKAGVKANISVFVP
jgi:hypothetical protein